MCTFYFLISVSGLFQIVAFFLNCNVVNTVMPFKNTGFRADYWLKRQRSEKILLWHPSPVLQECNSQVYQLPTNYFDSEVVQDRRREMLSLWDLQSSILMDANGFLCNSSEVLLLSIFLANVHLSLNTKKQPCMVIHMTVL